MPKLFHTDGDLSIQFCQADDKNITWMKDWLHILYKPINQMSNPIFV